MKFRIVDKQEMYVEQKTKVSVEVIETIGDLTRVKDKVRFELPGVYTQEQLITEIANFLNSHGIAVASV